MKLTCSLFTFLILIHTRMWCAEGLVNQGEWRELLPSAAEQSEWQEKLKDHPLNRTSVIRDIYPLKKADLEAILNIDTLPLVATEGEVGTYKKQLLEASDKVDSRISKAQPILRFLLHRYKTIDEVRAAQAAERIWIDKGHFLMQVKYYKVEEKEKYLLVKQALECFVKAAKLGSGTALSIVQNVFDHGDFGVTPQMRRGELYNCSSDPLRKKLSRLIVKRKKKILRGIN